MLYSSWVIEEWQQAHGVPPYYTRSKFPPIYSPLSIRPQCISGGLENGLVTISPSRASNDRDYCNLLKTFLISHISTNLHQTVPKESFKTIKSFSALPAR